MDKHIPNLIVLGIVLGVIVGGLCNHVLGAETLQAQRAVETFSLLADVFLRLIKMIIAPLVLSTVIVGIAHMGDSGAIGRIGVRSLLWFIAASFVSIALGLVLVNLLQPGAGLALQPSVEAVEIPREALSVFKFILHVFPASIFESFSQNNILQILVFSIFAGVALSAIGQSGAPLVRGAEALADLMLQITGYVMRFAPVAVFGALAAVLTKNGVSVLWYYSILIIEFYLGILLLVSLLLMVGWIFLRGRVFLLFRYIREPVLVAFSTASSEAALPKLFEQLDRFGVPRRISGFTLPLGYSFNLDGSMMYMSFATLFIAQAYGIQMPFWTQVAMMMTLMVTSKGTAAVPRASLVIVTATLSQFGLPLEGAAVIFAIDQFLDMGRTATNVIGNAVATSVIAKWEGKLDELEPEYVEHPHAPTHKLSDETLGVRP